MRWQRRDVEIAGETFSLTLEDGAECFEGVESFKYLGRILHWADENCPAGLRNIPRARQIWRQIWKLMMREGADPIITEKFYHAVIQEVIIFGSETWMFTAAMLQNFKGVRVSLLWQATGMKARRLGDKTWRKEGGGRMLQAEGTKPLREYINKRQATVAEWVALRPIFEVCVKETG